MAKKVNKRGLAEASAGVYQHLPRPTLTGTVADLDTKHGIDRKETAKAAAKAIGVVATAAIGYQTNAFASPNFMAGLTGSLFEAAGTVFGTRQKQRSDEGRLWVIVRGALDLAWLAIAKEALAAEKRDPEKLATAVTTSLDAAIQHQVVTIDSGFFYRPEMLSVVRLARDALARWLREGMDVGELQADGAVGHLPAAFVAALRAVAARDPEAVARITDRLATPFDEADERLRARAAYAARLEADLALPLFDGPASLRDLYQPLRAFWIAERGAPDSDRLGRGEIGRFQEKRRVVELAAALNQWLESSDAIDALRVVSGGPGSGKSSFARWWAAEVASTEMRVLLIPLHRLEDGAGSFADRLNRFARDRACLVEDPLRSPEPLLLILDGLDELVMQGNSGAEVAESFVRDVERLLSDAHEDACRLRVVLGGREVLIDRLKGRLPLHAIYHLLPYRLNQEEWDQSSCEWDDPASLLDTNSKPENDLRHAWWRAWGAATGEHLDSVPEEIDKRVKLAALSEQPLLNFLLALARRAPDGLPNDADVNTIYAKLLQDVWRRRWGAARGRGDGRLDAHKALSFDAFERVFQSIALAAWHGGATRAVTTQAIKEAIKRERLADQIRLLQEAGQEGALRLLTAFYWREAGIGASGERAWELTHKSFGEYLVARRLVRAVERIVGMRQRNRRAPDDGWSVEDTLVEWIALTGPTASDDDLLSMLRGEVATHGKKTAAAWQQVLVEMLSWHLCHGLPMHKADPALSSFREACQQADNVEMTLLATLNACARVSRNVSRPIWPENNPSLSIADRQTYKFVLRCFGRLSSITTYLGGDFHYRSINYASPGSLSFMDFSNQDLWGISASEQDLSYCSFRNSRLFYADLSGSQLFSADLSNANLEHALLVHTKLRNTKFVRANLSKSHLALADLGGANLTGANFASADFTGVNLTGADLRRSQGLTRKQLDSARSTEGAMLPDDVLEE